MREDTLKLFLYNVEIVSQAWANRRSPTVRQSIVNIFNSKKFIKIERRYLFTVGVTSFLLS